MSGSAAGVYLLFKVSWVVPFFVVEKKGIWGRRWGFRSAFYFFHWASEHDWQDFHPWQVWAISSPASGGFFPKPKQSAGVIRFLEVTGINVFDKFTLVGNPGQLP